ncbi:MAG: alpha/beta hydrolase [Clostridiales bacterium]|nr:alpha/beta hydrolase [Clostridiales bacterium]
MPSVISSLIKAQISLLNPLINALTLDTQRKLQDSLGTLGSRAAANKTGSHEVALAHCQAAWVFPLQGQVRGAALYLHGGAYTSGSLDYARGFGGMLAMDSQRGVLCLGYRLAPEHPFPAALEDALAAYRLMLARYPAREIALVGESAGGGLCFCLALYLKQLGLPLPGRVVALSPWVDLRQSLAACQLLGRDPVLSCEGLQQAAALYLDGHPAEDPLASPLYGDLRGLPQSLIITGGDEILLAESREMHARLLAAGVPARLHVEEGMWHVYPLYPVPEARQAQALVRDFLAEAL